MNKLDIIFNPTNRYFKRYLPDYEIKIVPADNYDKNNNVLFIIMCLYDSSLGGMYVYSSLDSVKTLIETDKMTPFINKILAGITPSYLTSHSLKNVETKRHLYRRIEDKNE